MAGSRLEKFGTVFTRVRDLINTGVIKQSEKPIWHDVYKVFPPKREPLYVKPHTGVCTKNEETVSDIFYSEDEVRAKFYEQYGTGPWPFELSNSNFVSPCQRFVNKYNKLKSSSDLDDSALLKKTAKALLRNGVLLRRQMSAVSKDRVRKMNSELSDISPEQQPVSAAADSGHTHKTEAA